MNTQVFELFTEAMRQPDATREQWVRSTCGDDVTLSEAVLALCRVDSSAEEMFPTGGAWQHLETLEPGQPFGRYQIDELIGVGGMGAVYKAQRAGDEFEQTVAIKILSQQSTSTASQARFNNERQILAGLEHPNIARLIDGGTVDGVAFIAMEFVEGELLTYEANRSPIEALQLFKQVCEAIGYAHNNLVLHRDIKPENVLVTDNGEPKLLDFGVAKISQTIAESGDSDLTQLAAVPLTPNYTAPERFLGEPSSVACDIYSLGIYLHFLIHGERPYDVSGKPYPEAHRIVLDAFEHRHRHRRGNDELALIIATAAHPDAERRYASVANLVEDIDRYLSNRPLLARGDDWRYVLRKAIGRNKAVFAMAAFSVVALIGALAYSINQTQVAQREKDRAESIGGFLSSIFRAADPYSGMPLGRDATLGEMLRNAEDLIEDQPRQDPELQTALYATLSSIYNRISDADSAMRLIDRGQRIVQGTSAVSQPTTRALHHAKVSALLGMGKVKEAAELCERSNLLNDSQQSVNDIQHVYTCANVHFRLGNPERTRELARAARVLLDRHRAELPNHELAVTVAELSEIYASIGETDEYNVLLDESIALAEGLGDTGLATLSYLYISKSVYHNQLTDFEQAVHYTGLALEAANKSRLSRDGIVYANTQLYHADRLIDVNRLEEAAATFAPAKAVLLEHAPENGHFYSLVYFTDYKLNFKRREFTKAEEALLAFKAIRQSGGEAYVDWHAAADHGLGRVYIETHRVHEAIPLLEKAHGYYVKRYGADHPRTLSYKAQLDRAISLNQDG